MKHLLLILTAFFLLCAGCVVGPKYENAERPGCARIVGPVVSSAKSEGGTCHIIVAKIDGLNDKFTASSPGVPWLNGLYSKTPLYLSPGRHLLTLDISSDVESFYGNAGGSNTGETGTYVAGSQSNIAVSFAADHVYRFTADLAGNVILLTLWDETDGTTTPSVAQKWSLSVRGVYSEDALPADNRR